MTMNDITVIDFNLTEDAAMILSEVGEDLEKQMMMVQLALDLVETSGRGAWLADVRQQTDGIQMQMEDTHRLLAGLSNRLVDLVSAMRGDSAYVDGDDWEDVE
jgi:hypothetical protein